VLEPVNKFKMNSKKGVIWVSAVLYILISLAVLSLVLVSVQPIINKNQDKAVLYQSESILREIDSTIQDVSDNEGTILNLDIKISRGNLIINSSNNRIGFELKDSSYQYSEEDKYITTGKITSYSKKINGKWYVLMYLDYQGKYNLTYSGLKNNRVFSEGDYVLALENMNAATNSVDIRAS
jgi:type II secretory pathway pseudopilin PulG